MNGKVKAQLKEADAAPKNLSKLVRLKIAAPTLCLSRKCWNTLSFDSFSMAVGESPSCSASVSVDRYSLIAKLPNLDCA